MYDEKNTECALYGTAECELLNQPGCLDCRAGRLKPEDQQALRGALERLREEAPEELVTPLWESDTCRLCREEPQKTECYALFDLVRQNESTGWTALFNRRATEKAAADVLPMQVACCKKCRGRYRRAEFLPTLVGLAIAALGLILSTNKAVYTAAFNAASWLPVAIFAGFVLAGVIAAAALRSSLRASAAKHTHIDIEELPEVKELMARGWKTVEKKRGGASALVFAKNRREHGPYTKSRKTEE